MGGGEGGGCENFIIKWGEFRDNFSDYQRLQNDCAPCIDLCNYSALKCSGIVVYWIVALLSTEHKSKNFARSDLNPCTFNNVSERNIMYFLTIKPTRCTNFSNSFLEWNSTCFGQFPSSGAFYCTHSNVICHIGSLTACEQEQMLLLTSCQQTCMTYTIAVCTVKNSNCPKHLEIHSKNKLRN